MSRLGVAGPHLPGAVPRVWNVPVRNPAFTGRDGLVVALREQLLSGDRAVMQVLHGGSGVGKTQLAAEYAHQFAGSYDAVWWIDAGEPSAIGGQLAELSVELGSVAPGTDITMAIRAVMPELRGRARWLLVFDNARAPADIAPWLPGGVNGHVLITSQVGGWAEIAGLVEVGVFTRLQSVALLCGRVDGLDEATAIRLAEQLGDLPVLIARAASYMEETGKWFSEDRVVLSVVEDLAREGWQLRDGKLEPADHRGQDALTVARTDQWQVVVTAPSDDHIEADIGAAGRRSVFVIYGHDQEANEAIFDWLHSIGPRPMEWSTLIRSSGGASPYIGQVLERGFRNAQAVIAMFTPDELVIASDAEFTDQGAWRLQARPNVLIEAGTALITHPQRTILVVLGNAELPSDLDGRHYVRLDGTARSLYELASRLEAAGCELDRQGSQWLDASRFPSRNRKGPASDRG